MRYLSLIVFVVISWQVSLGQVTFTCSVDSNQMLIGDQRLLHLNVKGKVDFVPDTISFIAWQKLGIETLSKQTWQNEGSDGYHQMVKIAAFDTGYLRLPPLILPFQSDQVTDTAYSNDLVLEVSGITIDSTGLAPIKPILREPFTFRDAMPYVIALLLGLFIIGLIFLHKKKATPAPVIVEVLIPPDEIALADLQKLRTKKLWQAGKIKDYQSELTHIVRAYIEARYHIPALESTTSEILEFTLLKELDKSLHQDLNQILNIADLIKFAKARPDIGIHEEFMQKAESFVHATRESKIVHDV
ncbi:MAG: hypothetical protein IPL46_07360 [Saprospiraceae bacterium]|nr:hypothetical protein [Saprospiraceae bacterium]